MKVLFVTDLHGDRWKYERVLEVAQSSRVDVVINGGDMLPKDGDLFQQGEFIVTYLDHYFARFDSAGIYHLSYLGNDDLGIFDRLLEETCDKYSFAVCLAQRKVEIMGYEFIGMNWVVDYPFQLKDRTRKDTHDYTFQGQLGPGVLSTSTGWRELEDWFAYADTLPTIEDELSQLVRPSDMAKAVYVIHMPPHKLGLDKCAHGPEVGSKAIYDFLSKNQPRLSLHGHIHESPDVAGRWYAKLGNTLCIQPGQPENALVYVLIDLHRMKFDRFEEVYATASQRHHRLAQTWAQLNLERS